MTDLKWIQWAFDMDPCPCASLLWCRPHTYSSGWCYPGINCTLLSCDDIQVTQRQQGQWGLERKVNLAHKTKRHLRFNEINKWCWKELPSLSHRGAGCQLNSPGFAVTSHKWKASESLVWNCNKSFWKMIVSLMIISLGPLQKKWVVLFHRPNYVLLTFLIFFVRKVVSEACEDS